MELKTIDLEMLTTNGIVGKNDRVKILARGEVSDALNVTAHACSETAKQALEAKGGSLNLV
jgi:large subunit ribosomal protein L15